MNTPKRSTATIAKRVILYFPGLLGSFLALKYLLIVNTLETTNSIPVNPSKNCGSESSDSKIRAKAKYTRKETTIIKP